MDRFRGLGFSKGLGWVVGLEENTQFARACNGLHAVLHLEFAANLADMPFHRANGNDKFSGNGTIGHALGDQLKNLKFTGCEGPKIGWETG